MGTVAHYVEVNATAQDCYDWWRPLTHLPQILSDVEEIVPKDGQADHTVWTAKGPLGTSVTWEARIVDDVPGQKIAWASVDSSDPDVKNSGAVRFDDHGATTGMEISMDYDPPAGKLGDAVAALFANPQNKVESAAEEFKSLMQTH